jgi:hypothetical protein
MPVIAKLLSSFGYVKISNYGLQTTPDDRIIALHPLPSCGPHTEQIVGWKLGSAPLLSAPITAYPQGGAPLPSEPAQNSHQNKSITSVQALVEDEDDDWQWQMIIAKARAVENGGGVAPVVTVDPTERLAARPNMSPVLATSVAAAPRPATPNPAPRWVLPPPIEVPEFEQSEQVTFNGMLNTVDVPARPSAALTVEYRAEQPARSATMPNGIQTVAARPRTRPPQTPPFATSTKSTTVVAVVPAPNPNFEPPRTVIAVPTLPSTNGAVLRDTGIGQQLIASAPRRPQGTQQPPANRATTQTAVRPTAYKSGTEENTLVDLVVAAALQL